MPFKFGVLNQRSKYYNLTNQISHILQEKTPEGIRYSSCYFPVETIGIESNYFNLAIFHQGLNKIAFQKYEIKTHNEKYTEVDVVKTLITSQNGNK